MFYYQRIFYLFFYNRVRHGNCLPIAVWNIGDPDFNFSSAYGIRFGKGTFILNYNLNENA